MIMPHLTAIEVPVKRKSGVSMEIRYKNLNTSMKQPPSLREDFIQAINKAFQQAGLLKPIISGYDKDNNEHFIDLFNSKYELENKFPKGDGYSVLNNLISNYLNNTDLSPSIYPEGDNLSVVFYPKETSNISPQLKEDFIQAINKAFQQAKLPTPIIKNYEILKNEYFIHLQTSQQNLESKFPTGGAYVYLNNLLKKYLHNKNITPNTYAENNTISIGFAINNDSNKEKSTYRIPPQVEECKSIVDKAVLSIDKSAKVIKTSILENYKGVQTCYVTLNKDFEDMRYKARDIEKAIINMDNVPEFADSKNMLSINVTPNNEHPPKTIVSIKIKEGKNVPNLPITFDSRYECNDFFEDENNKWNDKLSQLEALSIMAYTSGGDGVSRLLNTYLRWQSRKDFDDDNEDYYGEYSQGEFECIREMANYLDSAISKFELEKPIQVFRVVNATNLDGSESILEKLKVSQQLGLPFIDEAYCSTSAVEGSFNPMESSSHQIKLRIHVPAGKGIGAWVNSLSQYNSENEFLLARGTQFKILTDLSKINELDNEIIIDLEVESNSQPEITQHDINPDLPNRKIEWRNINNDNLFDYLDDDYNTVEYY